MSLSAYALTTDATQEIACAYAVSQVVLAARTSEQWQAVGGFYVPVAVRAVLEVAGSVTTGSTLKVALFADSKVTASQVILTNTTEARTRSIAIDLVPNQYYLIAAACTAASEDDDHEAVIRTVSLGAP